MNLFACFKHHAIKTYAGVEEKLHAILNKLRPKWRPEFRKIIPHELGKLHAKGLLSCDRQYGPLNAYGSPADIVIT